MKIFVYGASAQAKNVLEVIERVGIYDIEFFYSDWVSETTEICGIEVVFGPQELKKRLEAIEVDSPFGFVTAIGNPRGNERINISESLADIGLEPASIISDQAYVSRRAKLGRGVQIMPGCIVMSDVSIGDFVILNPKSSVAHDCLISQGCELSTGATLAGNVILEKNVWVGAGATVMPRIRIGENSIIGAGSVVTKNIPANSVCAGIPCRVIRERGSTE
ncbi:acetyltransferase [Polynucleobacter sp. MWH-Braz-FAM2G]|uniref:acetyltransferase n=1 Tax=Polynucleobacter sp. MWH-Braz-FAM2G TaxID=1855883 RepID=UPI001BFD2841|nr:acetyltransferase [Polynucleobacter sp. MWH-Braz-FAM2G]QWD91090.1 acetyltransferase [Polynucleobacter sp. MWH-Braz-FAM2G]